MRVKSFFTTSMAEAITQARKELGTDAVLLNSRKVPDGDDQIRYEVVFGVDDAVAPATASPAPVARPVPAVMPTQAVSAAPAAVSSPAPGPFPSELDAIRRQIDELRSALNTAATAPTPAAAPTPTPARPKAPAETSTLEPWRGRFATEDCHSRMTSEILLAVHDRLRTDARSTPQTPHRIDRLVREELENRIPAPVTLSANTVVLVGPPGAGKTTTLVKLAVQQGLAAGRGVQLISADPHRAIGGDILRSYSSILGASFVQVDTFGGFMEAMKKGQQKGLVLVDTPGYSASERDLASELAGYFECFEDLECQLVLPASMKSADLSRCAEMYSVFHPTSLLFTRLDETSTYGMLVSLSIMLQLPISFLGCGQSIPDDLSPASLTGLVERICGPAPCVESVA